ncbi:hypothetical protein [Luteolibacter soli]|uniref:SH3 domain-containing protein n=1 Tax=Luteolibacter soli TaxID=3135280 RepID=A0ABU9ANW4_9BACT
MKSILSLLAGAAAVAVAVPFFTQPSVAQQPSGSPAVRTVSYPTGVRCVVTLNPEVAATKRSGGTNSDTFEVLDNKVQGDFLTIDSEWLVLKEGNYENWIPRDKVLSMRVSR